MVPIVAALLISAVTPITSPTDLENSLKNLDAPGVREEIFRYMDYKSMEKGSWPRVRDRKIALAVKAAGAKKIELQLVPNGPKRWMIPIGQDAFVAVFSLPYESAYRIKYLADGKEVGDGKTLEIYKQPEELKPLTDEKMRGTLTPMPKQTSAIYPSTSSEWWIYRPSAPAPLGGYAILYFQDGQWAKNYSVNVLDNLIAKKEIPPTVAVFIKPGEYSDGNSIRWQQYDYLRDFYPRMLLEEYEPVVQKFIGAPISQDPKMRGTAGLSSGGICAFTNAWERPEKFGLVMSWIGSFVNIASGENKREGGHNYPSLIRKTDKKPIRVFLQDGDQDLDNEHGNWWLSNLQMVNSLQFKNYDYKWVPGKGFHGDAHGKVIMPDALRWLFAPAWNPMLAASKG